MVNLEYIKMFRTGFLIFIVMTLLPTIFTSVGTLIKTGDVQPLADNTIGLLLASDSEAFELERDLSAGKFDNVPEEYREMVKTSAIRTIFTNITVSLVVLYALFKLSGLLLEWNQPHGTKYTVFSIFISIIVYSIIGIVYFVLTNLSTGFEGKFIDLILSGIPLKSVGYGGYLLIAGL